MLAFIDQFYERNFRSKNMKTILFPTDFSAAAKHAVEYGYNLAKQIKANIVLCNAVIVPAEVPQAGLAIWSTDEYGKLMDDSASELRAIKSGLERMDDSSGFKPSIMLMNRSGTVTEVVNGVAGAQNIDLVVIGPHSNGGISGFVLGNHARKLIDSSIKPLIVVPAQAPVAPVKKIAFATDFKYPEEDLEYVYDLIPLARELNAEVLLTHVYNENSQSPEFQVWVKQFIAQLSEKANYHQIYYRLVKNSHAENGLDWLCEHEKVGMLAMVHRKHNFLNFLLNGSYTQKMAGRMSIPLLVFPSKQYAY